VCCVSCDQDLYQRCEKMRPTLFRLASDTEDNDEALGERRTHPYVTYNQKRNDRSVFVAANKMQYKYSG